MACTTMGHIDFIRRCHAYSHDIITQTWEQMTIWSSALVLPWKQAGLTHRLFEKCEAQTRNFLALFYPACSHTLLAGR